MLAKESYVKMKALNLYAHILFCKYAGSSFIPWDQITCNEIQQSVNMHKYHKRNLDMQFIPEK